MSQILTLAIFLTCVPVDLCPSVLVESTFPIKAEVLYEHQREAGGPAYSFTTDWVIPQPPYTYSITACGHPCGARWSDGVFCGKLANRIFGDGFETGNTSLWGGTI